MKKFVKRQFLAYDFEKHEKWLNDNAKDGLSLIAVGIENGVPRYEFEETEKDIYNIAMFLLNKKPTTPASVEQIKAIEQTGAECVGAFDKWAFFRRKSELGDFEIYSDNASRLKFISRILNSFVFYIVITYIMGIINTINCMVTFFRVTDTLTKIIVLAGLIGLLTVASIATYYIIKGIKKLSKKRKELKQQATLFE